MPPQPIPGSTDYVNEVLRQLFDGHGVSATLVSGVVQFPDYPGLWCTGEMFKSFDRILQLDVRLGGFDGDRILVESNAGIGDDLNAQAAFAMNAFANASFHVLLAAFFGRPTCHGTERETWKIGYPRTVYLGLITSVFGLPLKEDGTPELSFFDVFVKRLESHSLSTGVHWVRIYQTHIDGKVLSNEVLLDNDYWQEMQTLMAEFAWPVSKNPFDVRVFLVIKDLEGLESKE